MPVHVRALVFCSEERCRVVAEFTGPVEELEALLCDCGCTLQVAGWPEWVGEPADPWELVVLG